MRRIEAEKLVVRELVLRVYLEESSTVEEAFLRLFKSTLTQGVAEYISPQQTLVEQYWSAVSICIHAATEYFLDERLKPIPRAEVRSNPRNYLVLYSVVSEVFVPEAIRLVETGCNLLLLTRGTSQQEATQ